MKFLPFLNIPMENVACYNAFISLFIQEKRIPQMFWLTASLQRTLCQPERLTAPADRISYCAFPGQFSCFYCSADEETTALDFFHRNHIQAKPQWFSIFSACNYYIKVFVSIKLTPSSPEDIPEETAWHRKTVSFCTDLGYTGYAVMECYPHKSAFF